MHKKERKKERKKELVGTEVGWYLQNLVSADLTGKLLSMGAEFWTDSN
jgi:hypothetical protein